MVSVDPWAHMRSERVIRPLLTPIEVAVCKASLTMTDAELAELTGYHPQALKNVRIRAYRKAGVRGQHALITLAQQQGWITFSTEEPG